ncbi:MAG TPA: hypothetical protein VFT31_01520 [Kribbella sp.]|nr:hypothetical protein [Kribbella sp.]
MSDTDLGASEPRHSAPGSSQERRQTGWVGWIMFAGTMMVLLGSLHAFQGFIALFQDDYYVVGKNDLTVHVDYTAWGWTHLIFGIVIAAAGVGLLAGQMWARVIGVIVAVLSALVNVAFLAAYPMWSTIMIAIDILVIWALTVHGREMQDWDAPGTYQG